jgi:hypothetical protein
MADRVFQIIYLLIKSPLTSVSHDGYIDKYKDEDKSRKARTLT